MRTIATRADKLGRDPNKIKILWSAQPIVAETESEAREKYDTIRERAPFEATLTVMSAHFNYDLFSLDPDKPLGKLEVSGSKGLLEAHTKDNPNVTLREIAASYFTSGDKGLLVGSPEQVADQMQHLLAEGGGDGFQISPSYYAPDFFDDIVEGLIPVLQSRGAFRDEYSGRTLRDYKDG